MRMRMPEMGDPYRINTEIIQVADAGLQQLLSQGSEPSFR